MCYDQRPALPSTRAHHMAPSAALPCLQSYDAKEFDALVEKYEKLNWRIISKPGGATVKPDDFYVLYG